MKLGEPVVRVAQQVNGRTASKAGSGVQGPGVEGRLLGVLTDTRMSHEGITVVRCN